jgi:cbb3-type cytochrome oxidase subunit 3
MINFISTIALIVFLYYVGYAWFYYPFFVRPREKAIEEATRISIEARKRRMDKVLNGDR